MSGQGVHLLASKEHKLSVLGVRASAARPVSPEPAPAPAPPSPRPAAVIRPAISKPAALLPDPALDNDAIVKMIVGGLKHDTVVGVIQARPRQYTLTPDALLALMQECCKA